MKEIYWNKLNIFEKGILCIGWLGVLSLLFWIIIVFIYYSGVHKKRSKKKQKKFTKFFNPHTLKVVYVFGWIYTIFITIGCLFFFLFIWIIT